MSPAAVLQQPSRNQPVRGDTEQISSSPPRTFFATSGSVAVSLAPMHHPATDESSEAGRPEPDSGAENEVDDELSVMEVDDELSVMQSDLDAVDSVLEAIDRGDLDEAESTVSELESTVSELESNGTDVDDADQTTTAPESS